MQSESPKPFIPSWLDDAELTATEFRVLCHVARRGKCTASLGSMSAICRLRRPTIQRALTSLLGRGAITKDQRVGRTCLYALAPSLKEALGPSPKEALTPQTEGGTRGQIDPGTATQTDRSTIPRPKEALQRFSLKEIPLKNQNKVTGDFDCDSSSGAAEGKQKATPDFNRWNP
jgi:hypothetical protein